MKTQAFTLELGGLAVTLNREDEGRQLARAEMSAVQIQCTQQGSHVRDTVGTVGNLVVRDLSEGGIMKASEAFRFRPRRISMFFVLMNFFLAYRYMDPDSRSWLWEKSRHPRRFGNSLDLKLNIASYASIINMHTEKIEGLPPKFIKKQT